MIRFTGLRDDWRQTAAQQADHLPDRPDYRPDGWSIHYGGGGFYRVGNWGEVGSLLRGWWGYHTRLVNGKQVMSDIAYNYAAPPADGTTTESMRLRGERPNGAHSNSSTWGPRTRTYVFPTGPRGPVIPSANQLKAFALMWAQDPLPVHYHRWYPGQSTACPGDWLVEWIARKGWLDYLGGSDMIEWPLLRQGDTLPQVRAAKALFAALDIRRKVGNQTFGADFDTQVRDFQTDAGLVVDGIIGPATRGELARRLNL